MLSIGESRTRDLNANELSNLERFITSPNTLRVVRALVNSHLRPVLTTDKKDLYVTNSEKTRSISTMSSRDIRGQQTDEDDKLICLYKIGMVLNQGEVLSWTTKVRKLTSVRHKNILLRVAHGDIFSNARLHRFRLRDNPSCFNCAEPLESILHRITDCPRAQETWRIVNEAKHALGMPILADFTIENLLGAKDRLEKIELTLNAEIIHRLATKGDGYCPRQLVKSALELIYHNEKLSTTLKDKLIVYLRS